METHEIDNQWLESFVSISLQDVESATKVSELNRSPGVVSSTGTEYESTSDNDDDDGDDDDDDDNTDDDNTFYNEDEFERRNIERSNKISEERNMRMERIRSLFATQPKLEIICMDWKNKFVDTNFTSYCFSVNTNKSRKTDPDDLKYMINFCGRNLTYLDIYRSCPSSVMPLIKSNCPNLNTLFLKFHIIKSEDFENCFSNMPHLEVLVIQLECEDSTLPMTLVESLEQVCETLKRFTISFKPKQNQRSSPDSSVSVFSPSTEALMSTVVNMKNIEGLTIQLDHGVTDEFLINLINNAKNISFLCINGSNITDTGMKALNNAKQLKYFSLSLCTTKSENKYITDESLQCLFNQKLIKLDISNCVNVTNSAVITLVNNLPDIRYLYVCNSKVNSEIDKKIDELKDSGKTKLILFIYDES